MNRSRGSASGAHSQDYRGASGHDVAAGEYAWAGRPLRRRIGVNVSTLIRLQAGSCALHNRVRAVADGNYRN
jgi:hypothetical protein